jgi:hypothetical protein
VRGISTRSGAALCVAIAALLLASATETAVANAELLPDLRADKATDVHTTFAGDTRSELRLTTTFTNAGPGPLELYPVGGVDCDGDGDPANDRLAYQRLFEDSDSNGVFDRALDMGSSSREAGCMVFHPAHNHWHFDDFASYELLRPTGELVAASEKVSFCLIDSIPFDPALLGQPADPYYTTCDQDATEGISVGWHDVYASYLPGQAIDIQGLPDGNYCLATKVDPSNLLVESNELNNEARRGITIAGSSVDGSGAGCVPSAAPITPTAAHKRRCRRKARGTRARKRCLHRAKKRHRASPAT